jgi:hypothetical protein
VGRRALTGSLFLGGICLATLAYDATARESLWSWKMRNLPQPPVWRHAMGSRGYREIPEERESALFQRVLKTLPSQTEIAGQVWTGKGGAWLAVFHGGGTEPVQLFCRRCKGKPESWVPVEGVGWDALTPALEEAERLAKLEPVVPERAEYRDPRAIRY